jgi:hypothetical protein
MSAHLYNHSNHYSQSHSKSIKIYQNIMQNLINNLAIILLFFGSFINTHGETVYSPYSETTVSSYSESPTADAPYAASPLIPPIRYFPGSSTPLPSYVSHPFGYNGFNRRYFELTDNLNYNLHYNLNRLNRNLRHLGNYYPNNLYTSRRNYGYGYGYDY